MSVPPEQQVVFAAPIEGLMTRALVGRLTPTLAARIKALGVNPEGPFQPAYPRMAWVGILRACVEELYPDTHVDDAYFAMGQLAMSGFSTTLMGKALVAMLRIMGPLRSLHRMKANFHSASNYLETKLTPVTERAYDLWVNECNGNPHYIRGILFSGLSFAGAKQLVITPRDFDGHAATLRIEWS